MIFELKVLGTYGGRLYHRTQGEISAFTAKGMPELFTTERMESFLNLSVNSPGTVRLKPYQGRCVFSVVKMSVD